MIWLSLTVCLLLAGVLGWLAHDIRDQWRRLREVREEIQARIDEEPADG